MKELKSHIERIVEPIRATERRKKKMREELLAHLSEAVEEESVEEQSKEAALEHALLRFGDPEALRQELQASVPVAERILFTSIPCMARIERRRKRRQNESSVHHALRMTVYVALYLLAVSVLVLGVSVLSRLFKGHDLPDIAFILRDAAGFHAGLLFCYLFCMLCVAGVARTLSSRPVRFGQLVLVGAYTALSALTTFAGYTITRSLVPGFCARLYGQEQIAFKVMIVAVPCVVIMQGLHDGAKARRQREWQDMLREG